MLRSYLKLAVKVLLRRKFFTFISLFGISITLLILMVVTAMLDAEYGPRPPETKLDRSLGVFRARLVGEHSIQSGSPGYGLLDQTVRGLPGAEEVSLHTVAAAVTSYPSGERITSYMKRADGAFWRIHTFRFLEGGPYTDQDEASGQFVAVINEPTRRRFFGDGQAVGRSIDADGQTFRVVGVVEAVAFSRNTVFGDIYAPISTSKNDAYRKDLLGDFNATIVAHSRADLPGIRQEFAARVRRVPLPDPKTYTQLRTMAETPFESMAREFFDDKIERGRGAALTAVFITLMILFMVLPAINLVNLNVSRIMERASEIGVRKAFGASRRTLVAQFVVENVLLCLVGGVLGLILSAIVLQAIAASGIIPYARYPLNLRILFYSVCLSTFFGLLSGVYPALKMSRLHPVEALRGGSR